jgi:hypothetical protein
MKGSSSPSGVTNVTNPAQVAQQPYLNFAYEQAKNLYQNNPQTYYPGQTLAQSPQQQQGYGNLYHIGGSLDEWMRPTANQVFGQAATGQMGGAANPAYPYYQGYATGTSPISQNYQGLQGQAQQMGGQYAQQVGQYALPVQQMAYQAGANNNLGLSQLGASAGGQYLNANPHLAAAIEAAQRPTQTAYQTSIAPGLDAAAAQSGRYGSGAQAGMASTAQQNLVRGLGDISTNMSNANYARERQLQDAAAQQYGSLYNAGLGLGMTGLQNAAAIQNTAGGQFWKGQDAAAQAAQQQAAANQYGISGLSSGFNTGNQAALEAMRLYPGLAQAAFLGPQAQIQGGQGLAAYDQARIADEMARYQGNQMAPYNTLAAYNAAIGNPQGGSTSTPFYRNPGAEALSGIAGIAGIGNNLGLWGGAGGGLLGGLGGAAAGAGAPFLLPGMAGAALPGVAGGVSSIAPMLGMAAPAAWIVCTELMRQKKLPKRWWIAGSEEFASYPERVKRGYWVWAIPSVRHLRRRPGSLYSRLLGTVFRWRAEDIAARRGIPGARRRWRGQLVTSALWLPCLALGSIVPQQDWQSVYPGDVSPS